MNHGIRTGIFFLCLALAACQSDASKTPAGGNGALLEAPPYAGITDSIRREPKNAALYQQRAALLTQQGQYPLAAGDLEKAWQLSPSEGLAMEQVNNRFLQGKTKEAVALLQQFLQQYPQSAGLKRRLGEAYLQGGEYDRAIAVYDSILAANTNDFEAYYERATLYLEQKDSARAIADLEKSYALQPTQLAALSLANLYAEKKNPRALVLADSVIARDQNQEMIDPVFIKGIYYANTKNANKALEAFDQCIRMDWKFHEAYIEKGIIYFEQKNLDEALKQFKLAATVTNTYPDAYFWQGRCYEALGKTQEAISNYVRAYALDKDFSEARERAEKLRGG